MYQTKLDRWLLEQFIFEHHIRLVRVPDKIPRGVKVLNKKSGQYEYLVIIKNKTIAERFIRLLNAQGFTYKTSLVEGSHWYNGILYKKNSSFTYRVIWKTVILVLIIVTIQNRSLLTESDLFIHFKSTLKEVIESRK